MDSRLLNGWWLVLGTFATCNAAAALRWSILRTTLLETTFYTFIIYIHLTHWLRFVQQPLQYICVGSKVSRCTWDLNTSNTTHAHVFMIRQLDVCSVAELNRHAGQCRLWDQSYLLVSVQWLCSLQGEHVNCVLTKQLLLTLEMFFLFFWCLRSLQGEHIDWVGMKPLSGSSGWLQVPWHGPAADLALPQTRLHELYCHRAGLPADAWIPLMMQLRCCCWLRCHGTATASTSGYRW